MSDANGDDTADQLTMLEVFETLLDIAHKEIKPIQLIKDTGPQFILN